MSALTAAIEQKTREVAEAARVMRAEQERYQASADLATLPEAFQQAKAAAEAAMAELSTLRAREQEMQAADQIYSHVYTADPRQAIGTRVEAGKPSEAETIAAVERLPKGPAAIAALHRFARRLDRSTISAEKRDAAADMYIRTRGDMTRVSAAFPEIRADYQRTDVGSLGGFTLRPGWMPEMLSEVAATSVVFQRSRVIPTTTNEARWTTLVNDSSSPRIFRSAITGQRNAEATYGAPTAGGAMQHQWAGASTQTMSLGTKVIPVYEWSNQNAPIGFTPTQLEDQAVDLLATAREVLGEAAVWSLEYEGVNGDGQGMGTGLLNAGITGVNTSSSGLPSYEGYTNLILGATGLPSQYRNGATLLMHTDTYAKTLQLRSGGSTSTDGPFLINVNTAPLSVLGHEIIFSEEMPATGQAAAKLCVFGNLGFMGYAMRVDFTVLQQAHGLDTLVFGRARWGCSPLITAAFRIMVGS